MSLEVHNIAVAGFGLRPQKVVEGDFIQGRRRSVGRNMTADSALNAVRTHNHGHCVPTHQALDTPLHLLTAGERSLLTGGNGVLIRSGSGEGKVDSGGPARM